MAQPVRKSEALESFRRIRGDRLVDRFYELFLHSDERIRAMFAETDFARQKQMLQHGILMLLGHSRGDAIGGLALKRLGQRHHGEQPSERGRRMERRQTLRRRQRRYVAAILVQS